MILWKKYMAYLLWFWDKKKLQALPLVIFFGGRELQGVTSDSEKKIQGLPLVIFVEKIHGLPLVILR